MYIFQLHLIFRMSLYVPTALRNLLEVTCHISANIILLPNATIILASKMENVLIVLETFQSKQPKLMFMKILTNKEIHKVKSL